ncbi:hypothetical protein MPSEU_000938200 [Mayamaea pseudoterrestris]|nr:hypothetical protein MPSEU_000938200 [Mayamaea pseudoterrestris]
MQMTRQSPIERKWDSGVCREPRRPHLAATSFALQASNKRNIDDDENNNDAGYAVVSLLEDTLRLFSRPTFGGAAVGIPIVLLLVFGFAPLAQGILIIAIFIGLSSLGRTVVLDSDEEDENEDDYDSVKTTRFQVDFFALVAAILTGILLTPSPSNDSNSILSTVPLTSMEGLASIAIVGGALLLWSILQASTSSMSEEKQGLEDWDYKFFDNQNKKGSRDGEDDGKDFR